LFEFAFANGRRQLLCHLNRQAVCGGDGFEQIGHTNKQVKASSQKPADWAAFRLEKSGSKSHIFCVLVRNNLH
jgi:hypothetical protein